MAKVAGKQTFSVALALFCLGHVAPGLDLLHQHSSGETCRWTCMQVSCVKWNLCFCWGLVGKSETKDVIVTLLLSRRSWHLPGEKTGTLLHNITIVSVLSHHILLIYPHLWHHLRYQTIYFLLFASGLIELAWDQREIISIAQCLPVQLLCCFLFHFLSCPALHKPSNLLSSTALHISTPTIAHFFHQLRHEIRI